MNLFNSSFLRPVLLALVLGSAARPAVAQDVSSLPVYKPEQEATGLMRSWGNPAMGHLMKLWEAGFQKYHPDLQFYDHLKGTSTASSGLSQCVADLALMGRQIYVFENYSTYRRSLIVPIEVEVATGALNVPRKSSALTVFVNKDNPLAHLTVKQLDGIFGAQRDGGWDDMRWDRTAARGADENIRTWGQLGLTGEWADKPIHPFGPPNQYPGGCSFFQKRVLHGSDTCAEGLMEFDDPKAMIAALAKDPYAIAYTGLNYGTASTKVIAIADKEGGDYVLPTRATVSDRTYPLARSVYIYFAPDTPGGQPNEKPDPKIREFLRYILSKQGQQDVITEGDYLPLTAEQVAYYRKKIDETPKPDAKPHY